MSSSAARLVATVCENGVAVAGDALMAKLGGRARLNKFLNALTVWEIPQRSRPKMYARVRRRAFERTVANGKEVYYLPRSRLPALKNRLFDAVAVDPGFAALKTRRLPKAACVPRQPLYTYQETAVDFVCREGGPFDKYLENGAMYVEMGTGLGKTRFAAAVAARLGGPAFFVVPTEAIRQQTLDEVAKIFPDLKCGVYKNSARSPPTPETHDIVVGIVNTVRAKEPGFFDGYALVVLDEAHELHSPKNIQTLRLAQSAPRVLGISATPFDREDGLDRVVALYLGTPVNAIKDIPDFDIGDVNFRGRVREVEYYGHPDYCETVISSAGTMSAIETLKNVVSDPGRMCVVAAEVYRLYHLHDTKDEKFLAEAGLGPRPEADATPKHPAGEVRKHGIFVFAELREYLPALRKALLERFAADKEVPYVHAPEIEETDDVICGTNGQTSGETNGNTNEQTGLVITESGKETESGKKPSLTNVETPPPQVQVLRGGATKEDLDKSQRSRIVLTTYGYSRRGVSLMDMTSIVMATPRRNGMMQILGRITRRGSDESIVRVVVDVKDMRTGFKSQNSSRRRVYKCEKKKYPISSVKCDYGQAMVKEYVAPAVETAVWSPATGGTTTPANKTQKYSALDLL